MKLGCNFPMGPLRLADFIGLDTCAHIMDVLAEGLNSERYRPCPLLRQLVTAGRLGDKTGAACSTTLLGVCGERLRAGRRSLKEAEMNYRLTRRFVELAVAVVLAIVCTHDVCGQCEVARLVPSDGFAGDRFGESTAILGDVAIIGASDHSDYSGAVYVYRKIDGAWAQQQDIAPTDIVADDQFGISVSMCGEPGAELVIVGATGDNDNGNDAGAAYIYRHVGAMWVQDEKIIAPDGAAEAYFGSSVSICGSPGEAVAIIGAVGDNESGSEAGAAYIFRRTTGGWSLETKLLASDGAENDFFGYAVSITGTPSNPVAIIGAYGDDDNGFTSGSAYVFRGEGGSWSEESKLLAIDGEASDLLGERVSICGTPGSEIAIVAAQHEDEMGLNAGAAYVFRNTGGVWSQDAKLLAPDGAQNDFFGSSVAFYSDSGTTLAVVGAEGDDPHGQDSGSAYVYRFDTGGGSWIEDSKLVPIGGSSGDSFGYSVALDGSSILVGAVQSFQLSGVAHIFAGFGDCNGNGILDCDDILAGTSDDYDGDVVPDECEIMVYNVTADTSHESIDEAIVTATIEDVIVASPMAFADETTIDFMSKALVLHGTGEIQQANGDLYKLADGCTLETSSSDDMNLQGELRAESNAACDVRTRSLTSGAGGRVIGRSGSYLTIASRSGDSRFYGLTRIEDGATLDISGPTANYGNMTVYPGATVTTDDSFDVSGSVLINSGQYLGSDALNVIGIGSSWTVLNGSMFTGPVLLRWGTMTLADSTLYAPSVLVDDASPPSRLNTSGEIFADIENIGYVYCLGDTLVVGDYFNNEGTTIVQVGTLTIVGDLTNNGEIIGDVQGGLRETTPGDGMSISGNFTAGAATSLLMPDPVWTFAVGGDFDVAIDESSRYDMSRATLHLDALAGSHQTMELMSEDIGPDPLGLDRTHAGHYPIGVLRLSGTTVELVDAHDNDGLGQSWCEAIYAEQFIIDAGAHVVTNGCRIYYGELTLNGTVDDESNLVEIGSGQPCVPDLNGDEVVNSDDLFQLLGAWGPCPECDADLTGDDAVDSDDLFQLLGSWGPC
jgi:hypothetical protein